MSSRPTILHDEAGVLAVDKPSGMTVIPAREEDEADCLHSRLETELGVRLWVVHRIDRDTSGIVVFARDAETHRALCEAFEQRLVKKSYLAFTIGAEVAGRIDVALHAARKGKMRPAAPGEADAVEAVTDVEVVATWQRGERTVTLVEARPLTGRQHQIRVHLRARDAPILGDRLYGKHTLGGALAESPCRRLALHAHRLAVPTPGGKVLELEAPWPADLLALRAWLDAGQGAT